MATVVPPSRAGEKAAAQPARHTVYVWELPVRIIHWTIVVTLIVLSITGYYIYDPYFPGSGLAGHPGFTMGELRFIHELSSIITGYMVYTPYGGCATATRCRNASS
jgi:Ni,Fe-hydrogenase I cytochrome b subunit